MLQRTKLASQKRKNRRSLAAISIVILFVVAIIVIILNLSNDKAAVDPPSTMDVEEPAPVTPTDQEELAPVVVEPVKPFTYPLTGLGSVTEVKSRPMMFMVENQAKARPQDGLYKADLIYEILAEGEITRFVAIYQSQEADKIGPVRSIRPYFVQLGYGIDALVVHAGWSQDAMNMLVAKKVNHFDEVYGDGAYYWRDDSRKPPHNLYSSTALIRKGAEKRKFRVEWKGPSLTFYPQQDSETAAAAIVGKPATSVTIPYIQGYTVGYEYDASTGKYIRSMAGKLHKDKTTGTQLTADNILVCFSKHKILDSAGRRDVDVIGPGEGYMIQHGQLRDMTWQNKDGIIKAYIDGQEVELLPGQTWIQVVPIGSKVEYK